MFTLRASGIAFIAASCRMAFLMTNGTLRFRGPNQSMQPIAGRSTISLHFMKTLPLQIELIAGRSTISLHFMKTLPLQIELALASGD
jgi:hypothetical protein